MKTKFNTVSVIGLGYIGLPTAAMFASRRVRVVGVDVNQSVVETINRGDIHIVEPELDILVRSAVTENLLRATTTPEPADAFLIAVPTPFKAGHQPDLSYVESAVDAIAPVLAAGNLVILESTSPVGTTEAIVQRLAARRPDLRFPEVTAGSGQPRELDVNIAYCAERVLPGRVVHELVDNARVIGGMTPACADRAAALYRTFVRGELLITDTRTGEMCKLTENSFRDVNIAFANELSIICSKLGVDVWELIRVANHHPRVNILQPGCGVGGHCIAVDPWFIVDKTPAEARLIRTAREVNDSKPTWVIGQVQGAIAAFRHTTGRDPKLACFGLAFKPDIDDLRESPALSIAEKLSEVVTTSMVAVEPHIQALPPRLSQRGVGKQTLEGAIAEADILVLLVDHSEFKQVDRETLKGKLIIDTRGIWQ